MASENDDSFDEAFISAFSFRQEPDNYDDLLGIQESIENINRSMPDFQKELAHGSSSDVTLVTQSSSTTDDNQQI